jgi:hypothetical protein
VLLHLEENWGLGTCSDNAVASASGHPMPAVMCSVDSDCGDDATCTPPAEGLAYSTTAANVQFQGSRSQGDRIILP